jgi:polyphosphate kinase
VRLGDSRVFDNAGEPEYLLASSDWMPRNLDYRVETAFPILDCRLQRRLRDILDTQLADTVKARLILPDGRSSHVTPGDEPPRSQERLYALAGPAGELDPSDPLGLPSD